MRRVFYDPYGNSNNLDDLTFNIDLQYGRRATLTGWSNTRDYHLGFLTTTSEWDSGARPKIVISGNLVSGEYCEVYLYQYNSPSSGFGGDTNPVTINGNGPYDSSSSTDGTDYALPTFSGITQVDSNGEIEITFDTFDVHDPVGDIDADASANGAE